MAEGVGIKLYDVTPLANEQEDPSLNKYIALASIAPGPRAATTIPPFLRVWPLTQSIATSGNTVVAVPGNAGVVGFRLSVVGNVAPSVIMTDTNGTVYDQYTVPVGQNNVFVPLAPGCTIVQVTNNDGGNAIYVSGQWAIDG